MKDILCKSNTYRIFTNNAVIFYRKANSFLRFFLNSLFNLINKSLLMRINYLNSKEKYFIIQFFIDYKCLHKNA
jgi:hypothetical protein